MKKKEEKTSKLEDQDIITEDNPEEINLTREEYLSQFMKNKGQKSDSLSIKIQEEEEKKELIKRLDDRFGFKIKDTNVTLEQLKKIEIDFSKKLRLKKVEEPTSPDASDLTGLSFNKIRSFTPKEWAGRLEPYRELSQESSRKILTNYFQKKAWPSHPKMIEFIDELIRRPGALEKATAILRGRKDIVIYIGFLIITFFLGVFYKKIDEKKRSKGMTKVMEYCSRFFVMNTLRLAIFVFFFRKYLDDTFLVFMQVFF